MLMPEACCIWYVKGQPAYVNMREQFVYVTIRGLFACLDLNRMDHLQMLRLNGNLHMIMKVLFAYVNVID